MDIDQICEILRCEPGQAPERVRELVESARLASDLLDGLRVDFGVGYILTPGVKDLYKCVDERLRAALPPTPGSEKCSRKKPSF